MDVLKVHRVILVVTIVACGTVNAFKRVQNDDSSENMNSAPRLFIDYHYKVFRSLKKKTSEYKTSFRNLTT